MKIFVWHGLKIVNPDGSSRLMTNVAYAKSLEEARAFFGKKKENGSINEFIFLFVSQNEPSIVNETIGFSFESASSF
jgi:hypothetical protein